MSALKIGPLRLIERGRRDGRVHAIMTDDRQWNVWEDAVEPSLMMKAEQFYVPVALWDVLVKFVELPKEIRQMVKDARAQPPTDPTPWHFVNAFHALVAELELLGMRIEGKIP